MKNNKKEKTKMKTLNLILLIIGISTAIFTIAMIVLFCIFQSIPDTLCERFYTVIVGECGVAGIIQIIKTICKHKYSQKNKSDEDRENDEFEIEIDNIEINDNEGDDLVG
jgi:uncharacterized membrane protein